MSQTTIFICEDDSVLRTNLLRGLREEGLCPMGAASGAAFLRLFDKALPEGPAACVIDIGLPDCDGRDLCQALRSRGLQLPVLFLTARSSLSDRLSGFAAGGDDYLGKPFAFAELVARLEALLRRHTELQDSGLELDPVTFSVRSGAELRFLTPTEFRLLAALVAAGDQALSRRQLLRSAWPAGAQVSKNALDAYVSRLRAKLAGLSQAPHITTLRGVGYRLS